MGLPLAIRSLAYWREASYEARAVPICPAALINASPRKCLRIAETPPGVLHFKSDCAILDAETILATPRLSAGGTFADYRVIDTADGEDGAANSIRVNDVVFVPAGFPETADRLTKAGYEVVILDISEAAKLDGGLSCMSLRFRG